MEADNSKVYFFLGAKFTYPEATDLKKVIFDQWEQGKETVLIDCGSCNMMDSYGIQTLIDIHRKCSRLNKKLILINVESSDLRKLFEMTRLDEIFIIENS